MQNLKKAIKKLTGLAVQKAAAKTSSSSSASKSKPAPAMAAKKAPASAKKSAPVKGHHAPKGDAKKAAHKAAPKADAKKGAAPAKKGGAPAKGHPKKHARPEVTIIKADKKKHAGDAKAETKAAPKHTLDHAKGKAKAEAKAEPKAPAKAEAKADAAVETKAAKPANRVMATQKPEKKEPKAPATATAAQATAEDSVEVEAAPVAKAARPASPKKGREEVVEAAEEEEVFLTDADGRRYCRVKECDQVSTVDGYCRYHYLLFWKNIQNRKKILSEGKLERYVEELTARYPDKFLELLRKDLRSEKDFTAAIQELEIDESGVDNEFEDEAQSYLDEVRGMSSEPTNEREEDF